MKSRIKTKIFSGFMLLIMMLAIAGFISIYQFKNMSGMVDKVVKLNYSFVVQSQIIIDALENQDSGVLICMLQENADGDKIVFNADSVIRKSIDDIKLVPQLNGDNTSEVDLFIKEYNDYYESILLLLSRHLTSEERSHLYFTELRGQFQQVKDLMKNFMHVNQNNIYIYSTKIQDKAHRSIMPGIIAIVSAILLTLMMNFFINRSFVTPIIKLTEAVKNVYPSEIQFYVDINSKDEIQTLKNEIEEMLERFKK